MDENANFYTKIKKMVCLHRCKEVTAYLERGWVLLAINHSREGSASYALGHVDVNAEEPRRWDSDTLSYTP